MAIGIGYLHAADVVVILLYLAAMFAIALWTICTGKGNLKNYFLAGRTMTWWPIGLSLFASNIGTNQFIGMSGTGAVSGLAVIMFEWNAVFNLMLLGWIFLPVYIASGIYTMPEYLQWRFGGKRLRIYLSVVALLTYTFATAATDLYAGALFINQTVQWNLYAAIGFILIITLLFTVFGGLQTVILTDALSALIMVVGGITLCVIGFIEVSGIDALRYKYMHAVSDWTLNHTNSTCGRPRKDAWHIFRDIGTADYPWLGTMLRTTWGSLWYWCANQVLVQRAMAAKDISHAKGGTILAAYLKLLPMFIIVFPGMISRALYPNEVACADPDTCYSVCGSTAGCSSIAYPKLVVELSPTGLRGLLVSSQIAAVVSSLTSIFNSASSMFTMDLWSRARPKATERELVVVGRLFIIVLIGVVVVWVPVIKDAKGGDIFKYVSSVNGYLGAPTCAMFVLAMFWSRTSEPGAFWGMLIAQIWGIVRFILDLIYPAPRCDAPDDRPAFMIYFHEYYHTASQILMAFVLAVVISFFTKPANRERLAGVTYWTRYDKPLKDQQKTKEKVDSLKNVYLQAEINYCTDVNSDKMKSSSDQHEDIQSCDTEHSSDQFSSNSDLDKTSINEARKRSRGQSKNNDTEVNDNNCRTTQQPDVDQMTELDRIRNEGSNVPENKTNSCCNSLKDRFLTAICGFSQSSSNGDAAAAADDDNDEDDDDHESRIARMHQKHFLRRILNVNAVILMAITVFLYGFFY